MINANSDSPNSQEELDLGPELFRCRRLSGAKSLRAQGFLFGLLIHYVLFPLIILPYLSLITVTVPLFVLGYSVEEMMGPALMIAVTLLYFMLIWFYYVWPRSDHFVLYERGIRIRSGFNRFQALFGSISGIYIGREISAIEKPLRSLLDVINAADGQWLTQLDTTAVTIVMKNGQTHVFKQVLISFDSEDLQMFFHELIRRHPRFWIE